MEMAKETGLDYGKHKWAPVQTMLYKKKTKPKSSLVETKVNQRLKKKYLALFLFTIVDFTAY